MINVDFLLESNFSKEVDLESRSLGFIFSSPEHTELMFLPEFGDKYSFFLGFERASFCRLLLILYL